MTTPVIRSIHSFGGSPGTSDRSNIRASFGIGGDDWRQVVLQHLQAQGLGVPYIERGIEMRSFSNPGKAQEIGQIGIIGGYF